ncbi:hypothetical protein X798_03410, partial [Onchocerca flexuosa]
FADESDLKKNSNQQKFHSDRSSAELQKVETVHEASVPANSKANILANSTNKSSTLPLSPVKSAKVQVITSSSTAGVSSTTPQRSNGNPLRYFVAFDPKSKQFTTSNESKFPKFNKKSTDLIF